MINCKKKLQKSCKKVVKKIKMKKQCKSNKK